VCIYGAGYSRYVAQIGVNSTALAEGIKAAVMLTHGKKDQRVPFRLAKRMRRAGKSGQAAAAAKRQGRRPRLRQDRKPNRTV